MLHGEVKINGEIIGHWTARRTEPLGDTDAQHAYECSVGFTEPRNRTVRFDMTHRYSDGALVLASKVLQVAARLGERR